MIEIEKVCVDFIVGCGIFMCVVDDVSLYIVVGEIFGIVGISGVGKSMLLCILNVLMCFSQGCVNVNGVEILVLDGKVLCQVWQCIGIIFQYFNLMYIWIVV